MKQLIKKTIKVIIHYFGIEICRWTKGDLSPMGKFIKENTNGKLIGCEIGVYLGANAKRYLVHTDIKKLYLIDPYEFYKGYDKIPKQVYMDLKKAQKILNRRLRCFDKDKFVLIKKTSDEAINNIPDELDFCYIDGNHSGDFVKRDLENYYPKIRDGGIFGGDDFSTSGVLSEVTNAVIDFVNKHHLQLFVGENDWWVIKGLGRIKNKIDI